MNRSNRGQNVDNPVKAYIKWKAGKGHLEFYNSETKEKTQRKNAEFIILDTPMALTGYSKKHKAGIRTNEIHSTKKETLTVWVDGKVIVEGFYDDIKDQVKNMGAKFTQVIYAVMKGDNRIVKLELAGSAFGAWLNFRDSAKDSPYEGNPQPRIEYEGVAITGPSEEKESPVGSWYEPMFETFEISEEVDAQAIHLDEVLQEYLSAKQERREEKSTEDFYKETAGSAQEHTAPEIPEDDFAGQDEEDDDLPF